MELHHKLITARKQKGLTQEELADITKITTRTIQRIESGEGTPRTHTLKTIAAALGIPYDELLLASSDASEVAQLEPQISTALKQASGSPEETRHFLQLLSLSCFTYLVIPFVHFLVPMYILKRKKERNSVVVTQARKIILTQIYWTISLHGLMLLTLLFNFLQYRFWGSRYFVHYLVPLFLLLIINLIIIVSSNSQVRKMSFSPQISA